MSGAVLEIKGVSKDFFPGGRVLEEISLAVEAGEILYLLGPSGSGKTTLMRLICGFETPDSGEIAQEGNLISRRGIIKNSEVKQQMVTITAEAPLANMFGYATALRSATKGQGAFTMEFCCYRQTPGDVPISIEHRGCQAADQVSGIGFVEDFYIRFNILDIRIILKCIDCLFWN